MITHSNIAMITIAKMSVAELTPPKKRPIRAGVGLVDTHCSFSLIIDTSTPSTITVAFSDDNWKLIRLMRSVAVREPSSEE